MRIVRDYGLSEDKGSGIKARRGELRNQRPSVFGDGGINSQLGNNMLPHVSHHSKHATESGGGVSWKATLNRFLIEYSSRYPFGFWYHGKLEKFRTERVARTGRDVKSQLLQAISVTLIFNPYQRLKDRNYFVILSCSNMETRERGRSSPNMSLLSISRMEFII